ncbi:ATP-grasp domain-containing protein [Roseibium sp.]|uniref:ATP-grasp domain-containing protein n=1 Tax=Roseibium sp. TaxID=1936156 RepID=UPI00326470AF
MAHICFIDSSATGLNALTTAERLGHQVTLIVPEDLSLLTMMKMPMSKLGAFLGDRGKIHHIANAESGLEATIAKIHEEQPIDAILTTSELAVIPTAEMARTFHTRYDDPEALAKAVYKSRCREVLAEHGIRSTRFAKASDFDSAQRALRTVGFPAVIKPTRGVAKEASAIVRDEADLRRFFDAASASTRVSPGMERFVSSEFVVESYIDGPLYSAEILAVEGRVHLLTTARRERAVHDPLIEVAAAMPSGLSTIVQAETKDYLQSVFNAVGLKVGIYHVEFILGSEGPVLVEINPRMMGGIAPILFEQLTGMDPYELLINLHLEAVEPDRMPVFDNGGGAVIAVGAPEGGRMPDDAEERVTALLSNYQITKNTLAISSGKTLPRFQGNFSILGFLALRAPDGAEALRCTSELLERLEHYLDMKIARISV